MGSSAALRWVRAPALAGVLLGSGVSLHVAAGGDAPGASLLGPLFLLVVAAIAPLLGALTSPLRITALLVSGEAVLHVALMLLAGPTAAHAQDASMSMSMATPPPAGHWWECLAGGSTAMVLAHLVASALVGVWLAIGERIVWTVLKITADPALDAWRRVRVLAGTCTGVISSRRPSLVFCSVGGRLSLSDWAGRGLSRRGPPRSYAV